MWKEFQQLTCRSQPPSTITGVVKESSTTKLHVVFDASAKTTTSHSLYDQLLPTPSLYPLLSSVLTKFRSHPVALSSDISKMFREILLKGTTIGSCIEHRG